MKISKKAKQIPASMTLEISALVKQYKERGKRIVGFTAGEPDFNTPSHIIERAKEALDIGFTKYTPVQGMMPLRISICEKLKRDNNLEYNPSQIIICDGAKSALFHAIYAICDDGDEIILPAPFWFTYEEQVKICGGTPKIVTTKKENGYKITAKEFEDAITEKTIAIIINSPNNPTGAVYSEQELREIGEVAKKHNLIVISDEIYEKLVYGDNKHVSIASFNDYLKENTIVINGLSKSYSMTGWRVGYIACSEALAKSITCVQGHTTSNACSISQYASVAALQGGDEVITEMCNAYDIRRKLLMQLLDDIGVEYVEPQGAFYLFMNIDKFIGKSINGKVIKGSMDFANYIIEYGVALIPGLPFHIDNYVRLSYAISEGDIIDGIKLLGKFISDLK